MNFVHFITQMTRCCGGLRHLKMFGASRLSRRSTTNETSEGCFKWLKDEGYLSFPFFMSTPHCPVDHDLLKKVRGYPQYPPITSDQLQDLSWNMCSKWVAPIIGSHSPHSFQTASHRQVWAMVVANIHEQWVDPNAIKVGSGVWLQWSGQFWNCRNWMELGDLPCRAGIGLTWNRCNHSIPMANHHFPMMNQLPARCTWKNAALFGWEVMKRPWPEDPCWRMLPWGLKPQWCYDCYAWYDELLGAIRGTNHNQS